MISENKSSSEQNELCSMSSTNSSSASIILGNNYIKSMLFSKATPSNLKCAIYLVGIVLLIYILVSFVNLGIFLSRFDIINERI